MKIIMYARRPGHRQVHNLLNIREGKANLHICREIMGKGMPIGTLVAEEVGEGTGSYIYFGFCRLNKRDFVKYVDKTVTYNGKTKTVKKPVHFKKKDGIDLATKRLNLVIHDLPYESPDYYINLSGGNGRIPTSDMWVLDYIVKGLEKGNNEFLSRIRSCFGENTFGELKMNGCSPQETSLNAHKEVST